VSRLTQSLLHYFLIWCHPLALENALIVPVVLGFIPKPFPLYKLPVWSIVIPAGEPAIA